MEVREGQENLPRDDHQNEPVHEGHGHGGHPDAGTDLRSEKPADKPAEKPADKPAEKPAVKPAEKPAEKPAPAPAGDSTKAVIEWKFEKDKKIYQEMTTKTNQSMKVMGMEVTQTQEQTFDRKSRPTNPRRSPPTNWRKSRQSSRRRSPPKSRPQLPLVIRPRPSSNGSSRRTRKSTKR